MGNDRRKALAYLAANAVAIVAAPTALGLARQLVDEPVPVAPARSPQARAERMRRHFPNVPLRTHDDRDVLFYDDLVKGKKVLINFTYLNCTNTCPRTTENLRRVQEILGDRIGRDIFIVSLSLDPERDTPEAMRVYAAHNGAKRGWTFATGRREDVNEIRRRLGLYDTPDFTQHMGVLTFGNEPEGKWAATFALDTPENIAFNVLRRVDPFKFTPWPEKPSTSTPSRGGEQS